MDLYTADILEPDIFWEEELMRANKDLLFGCSISQTSGSNATFVKGKHQIAMGKLWWLIFYLQRHQNRYRAFNLRTHMTNRPL
jgi:hypothetical protein